MTGASTQPLADAIAEYDRTQPERDAVWENAQHDGHVRLAQHLDDKALTTVRVEFWRLTKDRNSYDNCMRVDMDFMRRIAALGTLPSLPTPRPHRGESRTNEEN